MFFFSFRFFSHFLGIPAGRRRMGNGDEEKKSPTAGIRDGGGEGLGSQGGTPLALRWWHAYLLLAVMGSILFIYFSLFHEIDKFCFLQLAITCGGFYFMFSISLCNSPPLAADSTQIPYFRVCVCVYIYMGMNFERKDHVIFFFFLKCNGTQYPFI